MGSEGVARKGSVEGGCWQAGTFAAVWQARQAEGGMASAARLRQRQTMRQAGETVKAARRFATAKSSERRRAAVGGGPSSVCVQEPVCRVARRGVGMQRGKAEARPASRRYKMVRRRARSRFLACAKMKGRNKRGAGARVAWQAMKALWRP